MIAQLNTKYILTRPTKVFTRLLSYFLFEGRPATTKGRWFNPITFRALHSASNSTLLKEAESPVFITGTGRSGSTALGLVLSMHRDVAFLNEPKALWHVVQPYEDLIGNYTKEQGKFFLNEKDVDQETIRKVKSIYSRFLKLSKSNKILDKFPEMIFRIEFLNEIFDDAKFIFLYRNPWDTIRSTSNWSSRHARVNEEEDWWGVNKRKWHLLVEQVVSKDEYLCQYKQEISEFTNSTNMAAVEWIVTMNQGLKMVEQYPDQFLSVSYENLINDTRRSLQDILDFTGLRTDERFMEFAVKTLKKPKETEPFTINPILMEPIAILSERLGYPTHLFSMSVTE